MRREIVSLEVRDSIIQTPRALQMAGLIKNILFTMVSL
jgi:hypothetical protein